MSALPLPVWEWRADDAARVVRSIDSWASSAALATIVAASGGDADDRRGDELLGWLDRFSLRWDVRHGRERDARIDGVGDRKLDRAITDGASALGLAGREIPRRRRYDTVIMTGGMVRAGIVKPRFVRSSIDAGLEVREVVFLGAFRTFSPDEASIAAKLGVLGDDEWDAMVHGMAAAFESAFESSGEPDVDDAPGRRTATWQWRDVSLSVVAAPASDPSRRADTADTFRFWGAGHRTPRSVLVVTTPVYVPYQAAVAVEVLGLECGHAVETVGVSAAASDLGAFTQPFLPAHHLQELRSAIRAMRRLRARAAGTHQPGP